MRLLLAAGGGLAAALAWSLSASGAAPSLPPPAIAAATCEDATVADRSVGAHSTPPRDEGPEPQRTELAIAAPTAEPRVCVRVRYADGRPASGVTVCLGQEDERGEWHPLAQATAAGPEAVAAIPGADLVSARNDLDLIAVPDLLHAPARLARLEPGSWYEPAELRLPPCRELLVQVADGSGRPFTPGTQRPLRLRLEPTERACCFADTDSTRYLRVEGTSASFGLVATDRPLRLRVNRPSCGDVHRSVYWQTNWPEEGPQWQIAPSSITSPLIVTIGLQPELVPAPAEGEEPAAAVAATEGECVSCDQEPAPPPAAVSGCVVDGSGRPVVDAIVKVDDHETARTDASGCFACTIATASDRVDLAVRKDGHCGFDERVTAPACGLRIELPQRGTVRGRVLAERPEAFRVALVGRDPTCDWARPGEDGTFVLGFAGNADVRVEVKLLRDPVALLTLGPYHLAEGSRYTDAALSAIDLRGCMRTVVIDVEGADEARAAAHILPGDGRNDSRCGSAFQTRTGRLRIPIARPETELMVLVEGRRAVRFRPTSDHVVLRAPPLLQVQVQMDSPRTGPALKGSVTLQHAAWRCRDTGDEGGLQPVFALAHPGRWLARCTLQIGDSPSVDWVTAIDVLDVDVPQCFHVTLPAAALPAAAAAAKGGAGR